MNGVYGLFERTVKAYPERIFVGHGDGLWTYAEVFAITQQFSVILHDYGIGMGDRVVLFCDNSLQYIAAFFAIMRLGAVAVPVNPAKPQESVAYVIEKCTPTLLLHSDRTAGRVEKMGEGAPGMWPQTLNVDSLPIFSAPGQAGGKGEAPPVDLSDSAVAEILFTSGTTASPKGVTLTHGNLLSNTGAIVQYLGLGPTDSVLLTLPLTYSYGNSVLLTHVCAGAALILEDSAAFPYRVLEALKKHQVTGFSTVGSYANLLLKCVRNEARVQGTLENLRYITFAGEATSAADLSYLRAHYPHLLVFVMYGQTEASARLSYLPPELLETKLGSVGRGLSNVVLRVVDERGHDALPGAVGEIIAQGPSVMKGYWEDGAATAEVLKDGWLYTGDSGTTDEDGYITIKGRKSDMIKFMGHRISPLEIENVINSCATVKECAVVESTLDQAVVIKACVVLSETGQVDAVRCFVSSRLPSYMRPQIYEVVEQLPKTDSGKIKRSSLRRG